jgi:hypothetical protein
MGSTPASRLARLTIAFGCQLGDVTGTQNVAIRRLAGAKFAGVDVVVNRLRRNAQCISSLGNGHWLVPQNIAAGWVRATYCFRKIDANWLITHDHASVSFNFESGRPSPDLEP